MGMMETFGIEKPQIMKVGGKVQLAYLIPLPADCNVRDAVELMSAEISIANYGFHSEIRPTSEQAMQCASSNTVQLYIDVDKQDHADPMRLHGLSFGLALRLRRLLETRVHA